MSNKLNANAGIRFSKADPIARERLANGVGGGFVLLLLFKISALALFGHPTMEVLAFVDRRMKSKSKVAIGSCFYS